MKIRNALIGAVHKALSVPTRLGVSEHHGNLEDNTLVHYSMIKEGIDRILMREEKKHYRWANNFTNPSIHRSRMILAGDIYKEARKLLKEASLNDIYRESQSVWEQYFSKNN